MTDITDEILETIARFEAEGQWPDEIVVRPRDWGELVRLANASGFYPETEMTARTTWMRLFGVKVVLAKD